METEEQLKEELKQNLRDLLDAEEEFEKQLFLNPNHRDMKFFMKFGKKKINLLIKAQEALEERPLIL